MSFIEGQAEQTVKMGCTEEEMDRIVTSIEDEIQRAAKENYRNMFVPWNETPVAGKNFSIGRFVQEQFEERVEYIEAALRADGYTIEATERDNDEKQTVEFGIVIAWTDDLIQDRGSAFIYHRTNIEQDTVKQYSDTYFTSNDTCPWGTGISLTDVAKQYM